MKMAVAAAKKDLSERRMENKGIRFESRRQGPPQWELMVEVWFTL